MKIPFLVLLVALSVIFTLIYMNSITTYEHADVEVIDMEENITVSDIITFGDSITAGNCKMTLFSPFHVAVTYLPTGVQAKLMGDSIFPLIDEDMIGDSFGGVICVISVILY